jgi:hypothetical protein
LGPVSIQFLHHCYKIQLDKQSEKLLLEKQMELLLEILMELLLEK